MKKKFIMLFVSCIMVCSLAACSAEDIEGAIGAASSVKPEAHQTKIVPSDSKDKPKTKPGRLLQSTDGTMHYFTWG